MCHASVARSRGIGIGVPGVESARSEYAKDGVRSMFELSNEHLHARTSD